MRRSIDDDRVPAPPLPDDELAEAGVVPTSWAVSICDDYDDAEPRLQLMVEELGGAGMGLVAHLDPDRARRLRLALAAALREIGEAPGR